PQPAQPARHVDAEQLEDPDGGRDREDGADRAGEVVRLPRRLGRRRGGSVAHAGASARSRSSRDGSAMARASECRRAVRPAASSGTGDAEGGERTDTGAMPSIRVVWWNLENLFDT